MKGTALGVLVGAGVLGLSATLALADHYDVHYHLDGGFRVEFERNEGKAVAATAAALRAVGAHVDVSERDGHIYVEYRMTGKRHVSNPNADDAKALIHWLKHMKFTIGNNGEPMRID